MIIDKLLEMSDDQEVTASAATTDSLDMGPKGGLMGLEGLVAALTVSEAVTAAGAATFTFSIQQDDDSAFGSAETVYTSEAIPKADLVAGYKKLIPMPFLSKRYVRGFFTVATGPLTAGKFSASIVQGPDNNVQMPDAL